MEVKEYVNHLKEKMKRIDYSKLKFCIVQMNDDPASNAYVKGKIKDADELGIPVELIKIPAYASKYELLAKIHELNYDESVTGFIVQLPLPSHIDEQEVKNAISPDKDIDGFNIKAKVNPCTPQGIIDYLKYNKVELKGKNAVIIGRSEIVGKPMARMLLEENCNIVQLHSKTSREDMEFYIAHADVIVVAVGKKHLLDNSFTYKKSAVIVDVGINRDAEGLHGDAIPNLPVALQTPVPGGVGLLTRLTLIKNLIKLGQHKLTNKEVDRTDHKIKDL
jgi:methylenetetrahydrofolate dehydrogenase (NADP+)/methenyltetrahydrofolate cyclohydrolase